MLIYSIYSYINFILSILLFKYAQSDLNGVLFKVGLHCFKIIFLLGLCQFLKGMQFYSRVGLHSSGYGSDLDYALLLWSPHSMKIVTFMYVGDKWQHAMNSISRIATSTKPFYPKSTISQGALNRAS